MKIIKNKSDKTQFKDPILLLVFNRPSTTEVVFEKIRQVKPLKLYVAGDGPRHNYNDIENIKKTREIIKKIDWPCNLKTLFRDSNIGCKMSVSLAISWLFKYETKGIILEDDCVPNLDFFYFCQNLLNFYENNEKIMCITGNNFQNNKWRGDSSYYFSKYNHCWGWATWRRAWKHYDGNISFWSEWKKSESWHEDFNKAERKYWAKIFNKVHKNQIDSWAYPWTASVWNKKGLTATPNVNLVKNIGFGEFATHTKNNYRNKFNIPSNSLKILKHPKNICKNKEADEWTFDHHFNGKNLKFPHNLFSLPIRSFYYFRKKLNFYCKFK